MTDTTHQKDTEQEGTKHSPAGFEAPSPEIDNSEVVCAGCGESAPAEEMELTADSQTETGDGKVVAVTRYYLHNDEGCMVAFMEGGDGE